MSDRRTSSPKKEEQKAGKPKEVKDDDAAAVEMMDPEAAEDLAAMGSKVEELKGDGEAEFKAPSETEDESKLNITGSTEEETENESIHSNDERFCHFHHPTHSIADNVYHRHQCSSTADSSFSSSHLSDEEDSGLPCHQCIDADSAFSSTNSQETNASYVQVETRRKSGSSFLSNLISCNIDTPAGRLGSVVATVFVAVGAIYCFKSALKVPRKRSPMTDLLFHKLIR